MNFSQKEPIKITVKKSRTTATKKIIELRVEIEREMLNGTEWLCDLGKLESLGSYLEEPIKKAVLRYISSAEEQLIPKDISTEATANTNQAKFLN